MKKAIAASAAAMLALSACSTGDDTGSEDDATSPGFDLSAIEKIDEIANAVPESVKADGKLTVGVEITYAPAEFYDTDGTTPIGYDIDLMNALAQVMGLELEIVPAEFAAILPGIPEKYELGISSFSITAERQDNYNMIQYFFAGSQWTVQAGNPSEFDPADLCDASIGVQTGTIQDDYIAQATADCDTVDVQRYDSQAAVTTALTGGKIDAMMTDSSVGAYAVLQTNEQLEAVGELTDPEPVGVVVAQDDQEMTDATQQALQYLMDEGILSDIFAAWESEDAVADEAIVNPVN